MNRFGRPACFSIIVSIFLVGGGFGQSGGNKDLDVVVKRPANLNADTVALTIDGITKRVQFAGKNAVALSFPDPGEKNVKLTLDVKESQNAATKWETNIKLNGSGHIDYEIFMGGRGAVGQWPTVTLKALTGALDVMLNGGSIGTTETRKGIKPDQDNKLEWRQNDKVVCEKSVKLEVNTSRIFTCDATSGKVVEN